MVAKRRSGRRAAFRYLAGEIAPLALGAAIGGVWLMWLGGSLQLLMAASALAAATQLLLFLTVAAPPRRKRPALAHRMIVSSSRPSERWNRPRKGSND